MVKDRRRAVGALGTKCEEEEKLYGAGETAFALTGLKIESSSV